MSLHAAEGDAALPRGEAAGTEPGGEGAFARQLAALGPVLAVTAASGLVPDRRTLLAALARPLPERRAWRAAVVVEADGLGEALVETRPDGAPGWRLLPLPDTDFLAWEYLLAAVPRASNEALGGRSAWSGSARILRHARPVPARVGLVVRLDDTARDVATRVRLSCAGWCAAQRYGRKLGFTLLD